MSKPTIWQRASFNVPDWYSWEAVLDAAKRGARRAGEHYEAQDYTILEIRGPYRASELEHDVLEFVPPDATRYTIWLRMGKVAETLHFDIPDVAVPELEKVGLTLTE